MAARISQPDHPAALRTVVLALALLSALVFMPMWAPLVLAGWVAHLARPLLARFQRHLGGRRRAAGAVVLVLLVLVLAPIVLITVSLVSNAIDLVQRVLRSESGTAALRAIVSTQGDKIEPTTILTTPAKLFELARQYGARAWSALDALVGVTAKVIVGLFVFLLGAYSMLVDGEEAYRWARRHAPMRAADFDRFAAAFHETGRGLFIGIALTGLVQSVVATITYLALGVPSALVLGLLTFFGSLIPSVGTGLVWVPVAAGLALSGRTGAAMAMVAVGLGVISVIDNVVRPTFARMGRLDLPGFVVLVSMFGALALIGAWGLVLGPLVVRLFVEALRIAREERLTGAHTTLTPPPA